jgi:hypothetical protein
MTKYLAVFTGVNEEIASQYTFEAKDGLLHDKPHDVIVEAMESIERANFAEHHDYELHSVIRSKGRDVITGLGYLVSQHGEIPFTIRVSEKQGA